MFVMSARNLACALTSAAAWLPAHALYRPQLGIATHMQHHRAFSRATSEGGSLVQRIYELASAGDLVGAAKAMDALTGADVSLSAGSADGAPGGPVCYHHVYSDRSLSIGIFELPTGAQLPLHDHPNMTVLSKLVFGALRVTSYDLPTTTSRPSKPSLLGALTGGGGHRRLLCDAPSERTVAAPCETLRLDPIRGNIHSFEALEHTAIFDILTPPYSDFDGRSCHYYVESDAPATAGGVELLEVGWPESLRVVNRPYLGDAVEGR